MLARPITLEQALGAALSPVSILLNAGVDPQGWQRDALDHWLEDQLFNCCRHSGKSTAGAAAGLNCAYQFDGQPVVLISRAGRQSGEIFRKCRLLHDKQPGAPRLLIDSATSMEFDNRARILSLPGDPDSVRSISNASMVIVDEAAFCDDNLLMAVEPLLSTSGGPLWVMSSPFGKRGFFYDLCRDPEGFRYTRITADQCPHISAQFLAKRKKRWPAWKYQQEFFAEFVDTDEAVFGSGLIARMFTDDVGGALWA